MSPERHIIYDDVDPARAIAESHFPEYYIQGLQGGSRSARSDGDILSALVVALDTQISAEVASMHGGTPVRKFQKEIVMIVPRNWPDSLKHLILQVSPSPP